MNKANNVKKCCKINKFDIFALLSENAHVERGKSLFRATKEPKQNNCTTLFPPLCALHKSKQPSNCNEKITFVLVSVFVMTNLKV